MKTSNFLEWIKQKLPPMALTRIRMRLLKEIMEGRINLDDPDRNLDKYSLSKLKEVVYSLYQININEKEISLE